MEQRTDSVRKGWTFSDTWLLGILTTVARQTHGKIGRRCLVTDEDIRHDLVVDAFRDPTFLTRLRRFKQEGRAKKEAFRFADNARRRNSRRYLSKWLRLAQFRTTV